MKRVSGKERVEQIKQVWKRGMTCAAIADEIGCTRSAVAGIYHRYKTELRHHPLSDPGGPRLRPTIRWTPYMIGRLATLRKEGRTYDEIAKSMGVTPSMVSGVFNRRPELRELRGPEKSHVRYRPHAKAPFKPVVITNTKLLVEDWVKQGKVRRFERGETTDYFAIGRYLEERGFKLSMKHSRYFLVNGRGRPRQCDWSDVLAVVDKFRVAEGKTPFVRRTALQAERRKIA